MTGPSQAPAVPAPLLDHAERELGSPGALDGLALARLTGDLDRAADVISARLGGAARTPEEEAEDAAALVRIGTLQRAARRQDVDRRFSTVGAIYESLGRLRQETRLEGLLASAVRELGRACAFDRAVLSRIHGSAWRAEAVWIDPAAEPAMAEATRDYLTKQWIPLRSGTVEVQLVQRRRAALVEADDVGVDPELVASTGTRRYVAAPVVAGDRVVGFLQADRLDGSPELRDVDRDNLWTFAEEFGLVFERLALLERLERQRIRVRDVFHATDRVLRELRDDELRLDAGTRPGDGSPGFPQRPAVQGARIEFLSVREHEVLQLLVTGATNREIAERLVLAEGTVRSHVRRIAKKLDATGRADIVSRYLRLVGRERT
ncbi:LuxR C-terminal-related transcriptional regulator [Patulibacter minatonensis]|uniref:LuxR C-terminal-related transcriptional regulator n=1 Tax=Patulibacter minatonensis TaxID=298163 RepID=UPI000479CA9D|nr:LuxR C-terminal-related transcriptional regulator [Patulibacter minatonensis]